MKWKLPTAGVLVVVIVLAAGGAVAGLAIHSWAGAVTGAVVVALAGVATGYVPVFRERTRQRQAELKQAEARRAEAEGSLRAVSEPRLNTSSAGPSVLLRPEFGVVEFMGREAELASLQAWCEMDEPGLVRVIAGPGGVGKTRLALKVAAEWEEAGRTSVVVAAGREAGALAALRAVTPGPVLLVVDYAETRTGLTDLLRAALEDRGRVRVLLLARSLGEWWDKLTEESPAAVAQLLASANPVRLEAPVNDAPDAVLAAAAVPFFAARLGVPAPGGVSFDLPERRVPVLVLHAAALVAVLGSMTSPLPLLVAVNGGVLGELLEHEARYWRRTAAAANLPGDGRVLKAVVAAAVLLGAAGLEEAAAVAGRVPDLAAAPAGELRRWGRWLYGLYPDGEAGRLGSVQPDLLAEHHAVNQLVADPGLARAVLAGLTGRQAGQALAVLARAWDLHEAAGSVIEAALRADLAGLAVPAATAAVQTQPRIGELLESTFAEAPVTLEDLTAIEMALPDSSVALDMAHLVAVQRIRRELPRDASRQDIARWADAAGVLLYQVGRPADALPVTEEAVAIFRELAATTSNRYRPDLAKSLSNLAVRFWELGHPADALAAGQESVAILRELAATTSDRYRPDLARSLSDLGVWFSELGRFADALEVTEEAVAIRRELATTMPGRYRLASSLTNLGARFWQLGRSFDAVTATEEAVTAYRELATAVPDRYRPGLALPLTNLGDMLRAVGRLADALTATEEAVEIFRELAGAVPDRYRPPLAASLTNLGDVLRELSRPADALTVTEEAVAIRRELAAAVPDRYRPELATSLISLGNVLSELGRTPEAAVARTEAAEIRGASG